MKRREILAGGTAVAIAALSRPASARPLAPGRGQRQRAFALRYAPHFGMFTEHAPGGPLDELRFAASEGFSAWEDGGLKRRGARQQERIGRELGRLGMTMGLFVASAELDRPLWNSDRPADRERVMRETREAIDVARRAQAGWCTVVPGALDPTLDWPSQARFCVDNLRRAAELCERANLVMVIEPIDNHPAPLVGTIAQAFEICRAVDSPHCQILFDAHRQQQQTGHPATGLEIAWSKVGYLQVADGRTREEPGSGSIDHRALFQEIHDRGFAGLVGMDHGNARPGRAGERAVIDAYRRLDGAIRPIEIRTV